MFATIAGARRRTTRFTTRPIATGRSILTQTVGSGPELSIIIPCLNEAENVAELVRRIHSVKTRCPESFEVVFVDGRSTDGTPALISAEAAALDASGEKNM